MIRIKRYAPEELDVAKTVIEKLQTETEKAQIHYKEELKKFAQDNSYKIKSFSFKAYGQTKTDLISVYNGKCAYCETSILQGQPGDVEHFRPKSAIDAGIDGIENLSDKVKKPLKEHKKIKPGYYWLAADWYNLLLSCNSCNRVSTQLNAAKNSGTAITESTLEEETLGKGSRFPYLDPDKRIDDPLIKISDEKDLQLLIDPGEDNPEDHLTFVQHKGRKNTLFDSGEIEFEEKFGMIQALSDKGIASIQVFGLARLTLVQERERAALHLMSELTDLKQAVTMFIAANKQLKKDPADDFAKLTKDQSENTLFNKMKSLTAQFKNSSTSTSPSQYLGMKRVILRNWLKEENTIVSDLNSLQIDLERLLILELINDFNFIRKLVTDYIDADKALNTERKNHKKDVITKIWKFLRNEFKTGSEFLNSKKSLFSAWVKAIKSKDKLVIDTLITLGFDPKELLS